jgi:hypothetical protein
MQKLFLLFLALISFSAFSKTGVGVILGDPTALSVKHFMGTDAIDAGLSFGHHEVLLYGDYLKHFPGKLGSQNAFISNLTPYIGVGPVIAFGDNDKNHHFIEDDDDEFAFGGRIPFGAEWMSKEIPLGISLEIVPGITVVPETDAFVQGGLAIRYYL